MPVWKTTITLITEHKQISDELMRQWNASRTGAIRRIITEWLQYRELFGSPDNAKRVREQFDQSTV